MYSRLKWLRGVCHFPSTICISMNINRKHLLSTNWNSNSCYTVALRRRRPSYSFKPVTGLYLYIYYVHICKRIYTFMYFSISPDCEGTREIQYFPSYTLIFFFNQYRNVFTINERTNWQFLFWIDASIHLSISNIFRTINPWESWENTFFTYSRIFLAKLNLLINFIINYGNVLCGCLRKI